MHRPVFGSGIKPDLNRLKSRSLFGDMIWNLQISDAQDLKSLAFASAA